MNGTLLQAQFTINEFCKCTTRKNPFDVGIQRGNRGLGRLPRRGEAQVREDVMVGLESLPAALIGLLAGENIGKRMVKVV